MLSVDTNVVVRLLTRDDRAQAAIARSLFESDQIWIAKTVVLEIGWVLESFYGYDATAIREAFARLLALENVQVEDERCLLAALDLMGHGVNLADAVHLAGTPAGYTFVTFDRSFVRRAQRAGVSGISGLPLTN